MRSRFLVLAALALFFPTATCRAQSPSTSQTPGLFPFVLPWDDASPGVTNVSGLLDKPAGALGPVVVKDGHFTTGARRLRLVGVNLCFASDFPTHEAAATIAARMAKFGINAVRFHHMDMAPVPQGIWARGGKTLDPGQVDRLDYLFAELKKNGIYADVNLHVSRSYPGRPTWEGMPSFHKGVDNFDPAMIALQKQYARDLLGHVNRYTRTRLADDPAVAIVEINNENSLTYQWYAGELDDMPDPYARELAARWNAFLKDRYKAAAALKTAWGAKSVPPGGEMLRNGSFVRGLDGWAVERIEGAEADAKVVAARGTRELRIDVPRPAKQGWHVQLDQVGLNVKADRPYTVAFTGSADRPRKVQVVVMQAHEPWQHLWSTDVSLTERPQTFRLVFQPSESESDARLTFTGLGERAGRFSLSGVSFRTGGTVGLEPGESLGTVAWVKKRDLSRRPVEAQRDWLRFLQAVETDYWTGMARFLKEEMKVKAPVVGTPMGWSAPHVQAQLDAIDSHAYWQHPHFPGRAWDMDNWVVNNWPMAGRPDGGTLPALGLSRVAGKPFLCTEYNHSAPNTYASETAPVIFAYAAMQDWDGVFLFAYSHRGDRWDTGAIDGFFDIDQHPTKMATLPAAAALFLRGDVPAAKPSLAEVTSEQYLETLRKLGPWGFTEAFGLGRKDALAGPVARTLGGTGVPADTPKVARADRSATAWSWRTEKGKGVLTLDTPRSKLVATAALPAAYDLDGVRVEAAKNVQDWAVITVTALDGKDLRSPGKVLITATGMAENTGMRWKDAAHQSVGRNWGSRPSLVEGIPAVVTLPVPAAKVAAWALDERGQRRESVSVDQQAGAAAVRLGPEHRTVWYEVEIRP